MADATLSDTYVAAVQHDLANLPPDATLVGVVRSPTPWFHAAVDENVPELGPPEELLERVKRTEENLKMRGICGEEAHNIAWERAEFARSYREHLESSSAAQSAIAALEGRLDAGESIALVCYENTEKKRCHRTILRDTLEHARR